MFREDCATEAPAAAAAWSKVADTTTSLGFRVVALGLDLRFMVALRSQSQISDHFVAGLHVVFQYLQSN